MIPLLVVAVVVVPPLFVAWSLFRVAAMADAAMDEFERVVFCPRCDSYDIYDWGEDDLYACNECHTLFNTKESH